MHINVYEYIYIYIYMYARTHTHELITILKKYIHFCTKLVSKS